MHDKRIVTRLETAQALARRGFYVFPVHFPDHGHCSCGNADCSSPAKHPIGRLAPHGLREATTNLDTIAAWWKIEPLANVGIACEPSRLVVLDVDPRHGGDESLEQLAALAGPLQAATVHTGGGGRHFYFTGNGTPILSKPLDPERFPGLDVKAAGGAVVAPGSVHISGGRYAWGGSSAPKPIPAALLELLPKRVEVATTCNLPSREGGTIPAGARNDSLARLAGRLRHAGLDPEELDRALQAVNLRRCDPPLPEREVAGIAASVGRYETDGAIVAAPVNGGLEFLSIQALIEQVRAAGPRRWLLRGLWPSRDYGVHAAEMKAQKTWTTTDLSVSVASDTAFLHHFPIDDPGPVLMFVGEGGKGNILRRLRADAEAHGVDLAALPITICARAPHLSSIAHLADVAAQLAAMRPRLVTLDPLYLAARGANLADLYAMGVVLETVQHLCDDAGAALWIVTHQNRKQGQGAGRILGAGPAEWGRVLLTAEVKARHTDPVSKATSVVTELSAVGGEIPDAAFRVRRRIWADDPDDLESPLHVETTVTDVDEPDGQPAADKLTPAAVKLLEAARAVGPASNGALVDWIAATHGHGLRRETVSRVLADLERRGLVEGTEDGRNKLWSLRPVTCDVTCPGHASVTCDV